MNIKRKMLFNEINKICIDEIIISFHSLANIGTKQEENNKIVQKGRLLLIQASIIEKVTYKNILAKLHNTKTIYKMIKLQQTL